MFLFRGVIITASVFSAFEKFCYVGFICTHLLSCDLQGLHTSPTTSASCRDNQSSERPQDVNLLLHQAARKDSGLLINRKEMRSTASWLLEEGKSFYSGVWPLVSCLCLCK